MKKDYIVELREEEADELMDDHWVGELVRCKDCKHWISPGIGYKNADLGQCMGRGHGLQKSDWFCADGERK